ncbi:MAG: DNA polymerase III subunit delta [Syntrophaceae bacterium]
MDFEKVLTDIEKGKGSPSPFYLLYGEEKYLIKDALNRIIAVILPEGDRDLNLFFMDGENEDIDILCESILTPPLIPGRKIVVLRNTCLFQSRKILPEIIQKIRQQYENDINTAARYFQQFLKITGWNLNDLREGGWKKISDEDWQKTVDGDNGHDRELWLPGLIEACMNRGMDVRQPRDDTERLENIMKTGIPEGNHLIMTAETLDKRKRLFKVITETGIILQFSQAKGDVRKKNAVLDAAKVLLAESGKKLSPDALIAIGRKTGFNLADSMRALEMLITYTGERMMIEEPDVDEVVGKTKEDTVFDLTKALIDKDMNSALLSLKELFEQGINHILILSMIAREVRYLLHAKIFIKSGQLNTYRANMDYETFQKSIYPAIQNWISKTGKTSGRGDLSGQHPYVIYNTLINSHQFSYEDLVKYLEELVHMDITFKTTAKEPKYLLERFVMNICASQH